MQGAYRKSQKLSLFVKVAGNLVNNLKDVMLLIGLIKIIIFGFYGPFKNIALISSSRSLIRGGRKPEYP